MAGRPGGRAVIPPPSEVAPRSCLTVSRCFFFPFPHAHKCTRPAVLTSVPGWSHRSGWARVSAFFSSTSEPFCLLVCFCITLQMKHVQHCIWRRRTATTHAHYTWNWLERFAILLGDDAFIHVSAATGKATHSRPAFQKRRVKNVLKIYMTAHWNEIML